MRFACARIDKLSSNDRKGTVSKKKKGSEKKTVDLSLDFNYVAISDS